MVYVTGQVMRAGGFVLNERESMSVLEALALAGGTDGFAAPQHSRILRRSSHSRDGDTALQSEERFRGAETLPRNNNLALQAFTLFEWFLRDAIESLAAEIFRSAFNRHHFSLPPKTHRPMHCNPLAFATR